MTSAGFPVRIAAAVFGAVLVAAVATVALWVQDHHQRLVRAEASYAAFVLSELKAALETRLNLGLALPELPQADALLESVRAETAGILSVAVADETGQVVFSTDAVEIGDRVPDPPATAHAGGVWTAASGGTRTYGMELTTSFDTHAGIVVLRVPAATIPAQVQDFALLLALQGLAIAGAVGTLAAALAAIATRRFRRAAEQTATALERLADPRDPAGGGPDGGLDDPGSERALGLPLGGFAASVRARADLLRNAERELARLDEMA